MSSWQLKLIIDFCLIVWTGQTHFSFQEKKNLLCEFHITDINQAYVHILDVESI